MTILLYQRQAKIPHPLSGSWWRRAYRSHAIDRYRTGSMFPLPNFICSPAENFRKKCEDSLGQVHSSCHPIRPMDRGTLRKKCEDSLGQIHHSCRPIRPMDRSAFCGKVIYAGKAHKGTVVGRNFAQEVRRLIRADPSFLPPNQTHGQVSLLWESYLHRGGTQRNWEGGERCFLSSSFMFRLMTMFIYRRVYVISGLLPVAILGGVRIADSVNYNGRKS
ncbi:hypothetical protein CEXT_785201 [Caerostris extrusa]|uniref:Uncharacterized protein n=1 Tax=Caerostris extrusa TaxID=172846 RepID=A0AAV4YEP2_CAEEX|nr:hypothetical protein CEXT_785201 [Caerostris extrusa]